jgi:tetratricopeptide (TPR) repeat protein
VRRSKVLPCIALLLATNVVALAQSATHTHYAKPDPADVAAAKPGPKAPRLQDVGKHKFPVTTSSPDAQLFVNQGVNLAYGFNHFEAGRAFAEAARLDPDCAMAYWGQALVLGPNINSPMDPNDEPKAYELVQKAVALQAQASPRERAYINALAKRYTGKAEDRSKADAAFAEAMREVAKAFPDDLDAQTIFAEAVMDLRPWDYWMGNGEPYPGMSEAVTTIEGVIARNPNHPGALHYWIHLMEKEHPERAESAADRLVPLAPAAGHLVHMPSHIYQRIGRYGDAVRVNQMAIAADEDYINQCRVQGIYTLAYYPHNNHFLWTAATMQGRSELAIKAATDTAKAVPLEVLQTLPVLQGFLVPRYFALVRFGRWDAMLAEPAPAYESPFTMGIWHYARGISYDRKAMAAEAAKELAALRAMLGSSAAKQMVPLFSGNSAEHVLRVAEATLAGEMAATRGEFDDAIAQLDKAVRLHDALRYTEPDDWHYPARQSLGAVLLNAGRPLEAEVVYWEDLRRNPNNGWSLFGLIQALKAQGKHADAALVEQRFQAAWAAADVKLTASRF